MILEKGTAPEAKLDEDDTKDVKVETNENEDKSEKKPVHLTDSSTKLTSEEKQKLGIEPRIIAFINGKSGGQQVCFILRLHLM